MGLGALRDFSLKQARKQRNNHKNQMMNKKQSKGNKHAKHFSGK